MFDETTKKVSLFFVDELFFQLAQDYSKEEELPVDIGKCRLSLRKKAYHKIWIKSTFTLEYVNKLYVHTYLVRVWNFWICNPILSI